MLSPEFSRKADKFLDKAEKELAVRLIKRIETLCSEPFPQEVTRVENQWFEGEKVFQVRVGDYRILYVVNYQKQRLLVVNIDKRPRAYD